MRVHTSDFKQEISQIGKQISGRLYHYLNYDLITEDGDTIITEDNIKLISEQSNPSEKELIDEELIYSIDIVRNGQLLQSLMKEVDFEAKIDLRIGDMINAQFGLLVNNDYEYLDYGNYIIYSKEYVAENQTWRYVCYDKMLYSMVQYKPLDLTYPCTIRDYLIALADRIGLNFVNASNEFTNYNQQVLEELFEGQNITYRDILDKLSEITASNIFINDNDELELDYPKETNDTIDESYLKDVNVNFGEIFGPINKVAITETDGGYEYPAEDSQSIEANGLTQIDIVDNVFAFNGDSNTIAQNILNKLNGLTYYLNNFSSPGICYYDYLDLYNIQVGENIYKSILLNDEINISQGLGEQIFTEKLENSKKEKDNFTTSVMNNKQVQFQINKQKNQIEARVQKDDIINSINLSEEGIGILASKLNITASDIINIIANNQINLTSKNITIASDNFNVDAQGNCTANSFSSSNATITGGTFELEGANGKLASFKDTYRETETIINGSTIIIIDENNYKSQLGTNSLYLDVPNGSDTAQYNATSWYIYNSSGAGTKCSAGSLPQVISDKRLKENINYIDKQKSFKIINELKPIEYTLKNNQKVHRGLIAQEVIETLNNNKIENQIYDIDEKGYYSLCYDELIPDLINCVKYQQEQIETLQKRIEDLERKNK